MKNRNATTLMFIDLWLCKVFPIQNTLPKAKNTNLGLFLGGKKKKKKKIKVWIVFSFLNRYKLLLKLSFENKKLFMQSNHSLLSCLTLIEACISVNAGGRCDMAVVSNAFAADQQQPEMVSFQMFMTKLIFTDKEILYWYEAGSSKATLT